ncbi:MAG: response regulator transcription factor [Candidatus Nomurabacteria bacterium]|jgi:DNA-binding response OmpR family regulator|nr:response regulator transcription factor [Candidatus Nomurabacteria bacterium]
MRILVVEDEQRMAELLQSGLKMENYDVDVALDGEAAMKKIKTEDFDLMLLDQMLPELDGKEVCRQTRELGKTLPIIFLSARCRLDDKVGGLNAGADDYINKPFSFEELLARIKAFLRRGGENGGGRLLRNGNLTLDIAGHLAIKNGKPLDLSMTEFSLLEFFMKNQGKVISKQDIAKHCWNTERGISQNTLWVYVKKLRDKIGASRIKTVHGFGYEMEAR